MQAIQRIFSLLFLPLLTERLTVIPIKKVPQLKLIYSVACSSILELSHCSVFKVRIPTFIKVRSQYSTSQLSTEIQTYLVFGGPKWTRTIDLSIISRVL